MIGTLMTVAELEMMIVELGEKLAASRRQNKRLREQAKLLKEKMIRDPLTDLYTRGYLNDRARALESEARRKKYPDVFVLFIDIDHFKAVNDSRGHAAGDIVLAATARCIQTALRDDDVVARYGGEEIVVLGRGDGPTAAERIRMAVTEQIVANVVVTISVGVATFDPSVDENHNGRDTITDAITRADAAMYQAKHTGRNRVVVVPAPH